MWFLMLQKHFNIDVCGGSTAFEDSLTKWPLEELQFLLGFIYQPWRLSLGPASCMLYAQKAPTPKCAHLIECESLHV